MGAVGAVGVEVEAVGVEVGVKICNSGGISVLALEAVTVLLLPEPTKVHRP